MKRRILALLLVLVLALTAFAGCGSKDGDEDEGDGGKEEAAQQLLTSGSFYELTDEDGDTAGYLGVAKKKLTVYDEDGEEIDEIKYSFDEESGAYLDEDEEELFTVTSRKKTLTLKTKTNDLFPKGKYTLEEIDEEDIGGGGTQQGGGEPTDGPADSVDELVRDGSYAIYDDYGYLNCYATVSGGSVQLYSTDGRSLGNSTLRLSGGDNQRQTYAYDGNELTVYTDGGDVCLELGGDTYTAESIRASEIPVYSEPTATPAPTPSPSNTGADGETREVRLLYGDRLSLYATLPGALADAVTTDGRDFEAKVESAGGGFYMTGSYAEGDDRDDALDVIFDGSVPANVTGEDVANALMELVAEGAIDTSFTGVEVDEPTTFTFYDWIDSYDLYCFDVYGWADSNSGYQDIYGYVYLDDDVIVAVLLMAWASLEDGDYDAYDEAYDLYCDDWLYSLPGNFELS